MSRSKVKQPASGEADPPPRASRRAMQAEQTRLDILSAARRRFAQQGYGATTVKDIAADAGVAVQTVYDSVGGKPQLVRQLNDLIDAEANIAEIAAGLGDEVDPAKVVRIPARITRQLVERCGDILRASLTGSYTEAELAQLLQEGQRRHRGGAAAVANRLNALDALRPELSVTGATTTLAALCDFRLALILSEELGVTGDELEEWIATAAARSLLRSES